MAEHPKTGISDEPALKIGVMALSCLAASVIALGFFVTPPNRGGGPVFVEALKPVMERFGLSESFFELAGGDNSSGASDNAGDQNLRFIVRFENSEEAETAMRVFRENRGRGAQNFAEWADGTERFRGFRLVAVTPAGEAVLSYEGLLDQNDGEDTIRRLTRQLTEAPGVVYADPDPFGLPG